MKCVCQAPFFSISKHGADPNQTESEHHLTPIHVLCDAEYHGQSLRVKEEKPFRQIVFHSFIV